jgi:ribosomal protein L7/L12
MSYDGYSTHLVGDGPQILVEMNGKDKALATKKRLEALGAKIQIA